MCALFGFLDYGHSVSARVLQKLVQLLANASEVRGTHACGIAYNQGKQLTVYKRPKPAHKLHLRIPNGTRVVMGHTRFTTQGSQKMNYNNHPFRGTVDVPFALAHNGVLYNDGQLRMEKNLPATPIETDSYIAVQLIESQHNLSFESLRYMAEEVCGNFVFTVLDANNALWFVKGDNPLYLIHFPDLGLYIYTSTPDIMTTALQRSALHWMRYEVIDAEEGDIIRITPDGKIERDHFHVAPVFGFGLRYSRHRFSFAEELDNGCMEDEEMQMYMEEYEDLLDLCGYFGVTRKQVFQLLQMGYSYDEIEDYLFTYGEHTEENDLCNLCCEL